MYGKYNTILYFNLKVEHTVENVLKTYKLFGKSAAVSIHGTFCPSLGSPNVVLQLSPAGLRMMRFQY